MSDEQENLCPEGDARPSAAVSVLAFAGLGASFMSTILIPVQAELPAMLNASREDTAWVITATLLVSAVSAPISGRLGDMYGKRRISIVLLSLLVAGSVLAAFAVDLPALLVARSLQGTGMGIIPLGISMLRDLLPAHKLGPAIALVSATLGVGGAISLPLSAYVVENFDWHVLFWIAAVINAIALALYIRVIPPIRGSAGGRFDFLGALGLSLGLVGVLLAVSKGNEWGWSTPPTLAYLVGGCAVLAIWGAYELRVSSALVDLRVTVRPQVLLTNLASVAMGFALFASVIVYPQLLELPTETGGMGLTLLQAGLILMPSGLAMLATSPVAGALERKVGAKPLLVAGAVVMAISYLIAIVIDLQIWHVLVLNTAIGVGIGLGYAAMPTLIMQAVPLHESAAANGLNTLMRSLGTSIAAATTAALLAQSAITVEGVSVPGPDGYRAALLAGLVAAGVCGGLALLIPPARARPDEAPALPDDAI